MSGGSSYSGAFSGVHALAIHPFWRRAIWLLPIFTLALTCSVFWSTRSLVHLTDQQHFERASSILLDELSSSQDRLEESLWSSRGLINASNDVSHDEWLTFIEALRIADRYHGLKCLGSIPIVNQENLAPFIQSVQADLNPKYQIYPTVSRSHHYPIRYLEPLAGNSSYVGFDLASSDALVKVLEESRSSGKALVSRPNALDFPEYGYGTFCMVLPVFGKRPHERTPDGRLASCQGWVIGIVSAKRFFEPLLKQVNKELSFELWDTEDHEPFFKPDLKMDERTGGKKFRTERNLVFAGREWRVKISTSASFVFSKGDSDANWILAMGLSLSLMIGVMLHWIQNMTNRASEIASQMTRDLREANSHLETEIQHREAAEVELSEVVHRLQAILDASTDVSIISVDLKGVIQIFNCGAERMLGYQRDELVGKETPAVFHLSAEIAARGRELSEEYKEQIQGFDVFAYNLRHDKSESRIWTYVRKDGSTFRVNLMTTAVKNYENKLIGYLGIAVNIEARLEAESALRKNEMLFRGMNEASPLGVLVTDQAGSCVYVNPAFQKIVGQSLEHCQDQGWLRAVYHEDRSSVEEGWKRFIDSESSFRIETRFVYPDGRLIWTSIKAAVMKDGESRSGFIATIEDISERHQANQKIAESELRHRAILDTAADAIVTINQTGLIESFNHSAEGLFGYKAEEVLDKNVDILMPEPMRREHDNYLSRYLSTGIAHIIGKGRETTALRKDGTIFPIYLALAEVGLKDRRVFTGIIRDITFAKRYEASLEAAKEVAEHSARAKSEFLASMSHEIRTPMNGVIGMINLLLETRLNPEQRDYAETIRMSGETLLTIINDILDFSKIEQGKLELEEAPFDLQASIEDTMDLLAPLASKKNLELLYHLDLDVPHIIIGDVTRLRQVIVNLVNNALKFTHKGEVLLQVRVKSQGDEHVDLEFMVKDSGIGIPQERLDRLFKAFSQVDSSTTRKYGGTGLGLAISAKLVQQMGGQIQVESQPGEGSKFSFTITFSIEKNLLRRKDLSTSSLNGKSALIVDDSKTNLKILTLQLENWGIRVSATRLPIEALNWIRHGQHFDMVILDMEMPEMNGCQLARQLNLLASPKSMPMVLLTSIGTIGLTPRDELLFRAIASKPVKPAVLGTLLVEALQGKMERIEKVSEDKQVLNAQFAKAAPMRILVAEDNLVNQKIIFRILEKLGYQAVIVANGMEVLDSVHLVNYDLILMDVQMPEMDGFEATRIFRERYPDSKTKIVAMTANALKGDRERCLEIGMDDYLSKPISLTQVMHALKNWAPNGTHIRMDDAIS